MSLGLRVALTGWMVGLALLVAGLAIAVHTALEVHDTVSHAAERTSAVAQQVALLAGRAAAEPGGAAGMAQDRALRALFETSLAGDPTLLDLAVYDARGIAIAHSDSMRLGRSYAVRPRLARLEQGNVFVQALRLLGPPKVYEEIVVLRAGQHPFGDVRVGVSTALLRDQLILSLKTGLWVTALAVLAAVLAAVAFAQAIAGRVRKLTTGLERFREGEFGYRLAVEGEDELARLASSINELGERLELTRARAAAGPTSPDELLLATGELSEWAKVVSGLVHEMANPLHAAALHLGLLKSKWREPHSAAARHLRVLEEELKRLENVVLGFRRFSMLGEMHHIWFDLKQMLVEVVLRAREDRSDARIEVRLDDRGAPTRFWGAPSLLRQALGNLITNAEQAMPGGGVITVGARRGEDGIEISVADQGIGIPQEVQQHVFDLYFTTKSGGSGIGLAVVQQVAKLHGGAVTLRSAPGEGTVITMRLPERSPRLVSAA
ncbi:MAG TPA: HAMP domain-containing sensor histidine kinase [Dongiaceae bacterium]|nr:HAMP domain-containing sensor histidine kinase [Dongiaceae bacterium]